MGRTAKKSKLTSEDPALDYLEGFDAKSQLFAASLNLGWQLALMVLIPIFVGVQVDKYFDTSPSFTLTALFLAVAGSGVIINRTFKEINAQQVATKPKAKKKSRVKNA